ncbi:MAG: DNA-binding protein [Bacteroidetes bacterium]|nr:DNA-binding protein [Bacteroidota bacterium]
MLLPFAFTEQGVAMLSGVLTSKQAIIVNIQIMGTFTEMRQMLFDNTELRLYIEKIKKKTENNTRNIEVVFRYLDELIDKKERPKKRPIVGFKTRNRKIK